MVNPVFRRYTPVVIFLAVQLLLVAFAPIGADDGQLAARPGSGIVSGSGGSALGQDGEALPADGLTATGGDGGGTGGAAPAGGPASLPGGLAPASGAPGLASGLDAAEDGVWPWTSPWLLEGDRSGCGPGGQLQDEVLVFSIPCVPAYSGENGGATYPGVTDDEIRLVMVVPKANPAIVAALSGVGLWATPEQWDAGSKAFAQFFNEHYNFYGRKIVAYTHLAECEGGPFGGGGGSTDLACWREQARIIKAKYDPFVTFFTSPHPAELFDELTRLKIVNVGGWLYDSGFSIDRAPYHWDLFTDGNRTAANVAGYWCNRMVGQPAERAGDPALRGRERKLAIVTPQYPFYVSAAEFLADQVSGGQCGDGGDRPKIYQYTQSDLAKAQEQMTLIATQIKQDGVTTVTCLCDLLAPVYLTTELDNQQWFPEHLLALQEGADHDYPARLYSPKQWDNAFGPSPRPMEIPKEQQDDYVMWTMAGNDSEPPYVLTVVQMYYHLIAAMLQWAGPNLTPETLQRGAFSLSQLGGFGVDPPWPGWQGNDPRVQLWTFGPDDYTANDDTKEVYFSSTARSKIDDQPGTYICANGCARTPIGGYGPGKPLQ